MNTALEISFFIFGALIGSFLNVVVLRLPGGEKLTGRSHCPNCGHQLAPLELVPMLSYLFLRGKCRKCRKAISPRYFIIELITGLLFALSAWLMPVDNWFDGLMLFRAVFIISVLIIVFVIDLEHFLIFDQVVFPCLFFLSALNLLSDLVFGHKLTSLNSFLAGGVAAGLVLWGGFYLLWFFSRGRALGFGDVKLVLFLAMALGWPLSFVGLFVSIILGGAVSLGLLLGQKKQLKSRVPFGTFLAVGWVIALFYGHPLLVWYLALLGF